MCIPPMVKFRVNGEIRDGRIRLEIEVPCGSQCLVKLPGMEKVVGSGQYVFEEEMNRNGRERLF